jgi:hypothetical protein
VGVAFIESRLSLLILFIIFYEPESISDILRYFEAIFCHRRVYS